MYSEYDSRGHLSIDCTECTRGINGGDKDKCSSALRCKKPRMGSCFCGTLLESVKEGE